MLKLPLYSAYNGECRYDRLKVLGHEQYCRLPSIATRVFSENELPNSNVLLGDKYVDAKHHLCRGTIESFNYNMDIINECKATSSDLLPDLDHYILMSVITTIRQELKLYASNLDPFMYRHYLELNKSCGPRKISGWGFKERHEWVSRGLTLAVEDIPSIENLIIAATMKREMLPLEKILSNKERMFTVMFFPMLTALSELFQPLEDCYNHPAVGVGDNMMGLQNRQIARDLNRYKWKIKGDCSKFDKRFPSIAWSILGGIIMPLYNVRFHHYVDCAFRLLQHVHMYTPTGEVFEMDTTLYSGMPCTSLFGTIMHMVVYRYHLALYHHDPYSSYFRAYSDDHIIGIDDLYGMSFEERRETYRKFGFELKKEDDCISERVQDMVWLQFSWDDHLTPIFKNKSKLLSSLIRGERPLLTASDFKWWSDKYKNISTLLVGEPQYISLIAKLASAYSIPFSPPVGGLQARE